MLKPVGWRIICLEGTRHLASGKPNQALIEPSLARPQNIFFRSAPC
jgi:hypothetical protein